MVKKQTNHACSCQNNAYISFIWKPMFKFKKKIARGHMRERSISFHCARTESKSAEIMLHKPANA